MISVSSASRNVNQRRSPKQTSSQSCSVPANRIEVVMHCFVSTVTQMCEISTACHAAYLDMPYFKLKFHKNSAICNEVIKKVIQKLTGSANYGLPCTLITKMT